MFVAFFKTSFNRSHSQLGIRACPKCREGRRVPWLLVSKAFMSVPGSEATRLQGKTRCIKPSNGGKCIKNIQKCYVFARQIPRFQPVFAKILNKGKATLSGSRMSTDSLCLPLGSGRHVASLMKFRGEATVAFRTWASKDFGFAAALRKRCSAWIGNARQLRKSGACALNCI
eukprot:s701_g17.t1